MASRSLDGPRRGARILAILALLLDLSCGGGSDGGGPAGPSDPNQPTPSEPTAKGTPNGDAVSQSIGPEGGTLVSADGGLTLTVPAGAVAQATEFSIQPVTNEAYRGMGQAYQLAPEGRTFDKPVQVAFGYSDAELGEAPPETLGLAYQDGDGHWWAKLSTVLDTVQHTLSVSTRHFSGWARTTFWDYMPHESTVLVGTNAPLVVLACIDEPQAPPRDPDLDEDLASLPVRTTECFESIRVGEWFVNGVPGGNATLGTVQALSPSSSALYTAPAKPPSPRTVTVTGRLTWVQRGVHKDFNFKVTVDGGGDYHLAGVFDSGVFPNGEIGIADNGAMAHVSDRVELDFALQPDGKGSLTNFQNSSSVVTGIHGPDNTGLFYCLFRVDGPFDYLTATGGEGGNAATEGDEHRISVSLTGTSTFPPSIIGINTGSDCETTSFNGATPATRVDLDFDGGLLTEVGQTITVPDPLTGWTWTIERQ